MKHAFGGLISQLKVAKEAIHELEETSVELPKLKCKEKKGMMQREYNIQELWDSDKRC